MNLRHLIRRSIERRGWTVADLHRAVVRGGLDVTADAIYRYLDSRTQLGADTLEAVLDALDLSIVPKKSRKS